MDESILLAINGLRTPWLDTIAAPVSSYGLYAFPLLMLFALRLGGGSSSASIRDGWLTWFVSIEVTERILKPLIGRPRPTADAHLREALDVLGRMPSPTSLAFPSGTATACFAGSTWIWIRWGKGYGAAAMVLASLVSLSRVYGGVHWPSDLVAGGAVGAAVAFGLHRLAKRIEGGYTSGE